jgi:O-antigen/teichoic acid export membrane protein
MIAQALIEICAFAVLSSPPSLGIDGPTLRRDLHFGLPTTAVVLLALSIGSVDRVVILSTLGSETLGYYGLALICVMLVQNLAAVPSMVMTPRLAEAYGRSGRREDLLSMLEVPLDPMARGFAVAVGGLGIALPALVAVFLPKYAPGMTATRIAMVGAFGMVGAGLAASCLGALDRMRVYLVVLATDTAVSYGLARGFVYLVPRLEAVALGWALGALLHMTVMMTSAYVAMGQPVRRGLGRVARLLVPLGYALFCSLLAEWLVARVLLGPIARAVLGEILFLALSLPLLLPLYRALRRR